jgi:hypothetical protein
MSNAPLFSDKSQKVATRNPNANMVKTATPTKLP